jgi:hypothetical protein
LVAEGLLAHPHSLREIVIVAVGGIAFVAFAALVLRDARARLRGTR